MSVDKRKYFHFNKQALIDECCKLADQLETAERNQITPTLNAIEDEIIRRAGKEWAADGYDFTVTITAEEYMQLCKERGLTP